MGKTIPKRGIKYCRKNDYFLKFFVVFFFTKIKLTTGCQSVTVNKLQSQISLNFKLVWNVQNLLNYTAVNL